MSDEYIKILKQRYAKGEITRDEYLEMKEELNEGDKPDNAVEKKAKNNHNHSFIKGLFLALIFVLVVLYLLSSGIFGSLFSGAVTHSVAITNPVVLVSGYAKTNLGTTPISITFGSSTTSVSSNGYYSVSLNNDQTYPISIAYSSLTGNSNCNAGSLNLQTSSSSLFYNATC